MDYKTISDGVRLFEESHELELDVFRQYIGTDDIQTKVINLLNHLKEKWKNKEDPRHQFIAMVWFWLIFRYCVNDDFKLMRGYINHFIDNENDPTLLKNAVNSQLTLNEFLLVNGNFKIEELQSVYLETERQDLTIGELKKSTKLFKNSIKILKKNNNVSTTDQINRLGPVSIPIIDHRYDPKKLTISFKNDEIIDLIYDELKAFFPGREMDLKNALKGNKLETQLLFSYNQNRLVEVFRRAKYNGFLLSTSTQIKDWLCANFERIQNKNKVKFNENTTWDILSKGNGEPTRKERICVVDWLPYKGKLTLGREKENEQL